MTLTMTRREPTVRARPCPQCGATDTYVYCKHAASPKRYCKCRKCRHTWLQTKS